MLCRVDTHTFTRIASAASARRNWRTTPTYGIAAQPWIPSRRFGRRLLTRWMDGAVLQQGPLTSSDRTTLTRMLLVAVQALKTPATALAVPLNAFTLA